MSHISPDISVIIPLFNVGSEFFCLLDDLKNQKDIELEVLIVASVETYHKALSYCEKSGITHTYIESPTYRAFAEALNKAISTAKGEYISIMPEKAILPAVFYKELYLCAKADGCAVAKARSYTLFPDEIGRAHV